MAIYVYLRCIFKPLYGYVELIFFTHFPNHEFFNEIDAYQQFLRVKATSKLANHDFHPRNKKTNEGAKQKL